MLRKSKCPSQIKSPPTHILCRHHQHACNLQQEHASSKPYRNNNNNVALFAAANDDSKSGGTLFFASEVSDDDEAVVEESKASKEASEPTSLTSTTNEATTAAAANDDIKSDDNETPSVKLFDTSTLQEANDALTSVGWAGVAPMQGDGEMTSEDPFVQQIDESIMKEMGVGLDQLLNPAKVSWNFTD